MGVTINSIVEKNDAKFLASDLGDETVMMDLETGNYIGLNDVGTSIWKYLGATTSIKDLIAHLMAEYNVSEEECTQDVLEYLTNMAKRGIISIK